MRTLDVLQTIKASRDNGTAMGTRYDASCCGAAIPAEFYVDDIEGYFFEALLNEDSPAYDMLLAAELSDVNLDALQLLQVTEVHCALWEDGNPELFDRILAHQIAKEEARCQAPVAAVQA